MQEYVITQSPLPQHNSEYVEKNIAEEVTVQILLNCYLRETSNAERVLDKTQAEDFTTAVLAHAGIKDYVRCSLPYQAITLIAGLRYWSPTGRHLFRFPLYYQKFESTELLELDYASLIEIILKELSRIEGTSNCQDKLVSRISQSCSNIQGFVKQRGQDKSLYSFTCSFIQTEQALVFGHPMHPTPKSRQGFSNEDMTAYSPEFNCCFPVHYFRAHQSIVQEGSATSQTATDLIKKELLADPKVDAKFRSTYCNLDEHSLIPVHPWQANFLVSQPVVQKLMNQGLLQPLGPCGREYLPTSSVRTVYHPNATYMLKLSLNIKITNSLRCCLYRELQRGKEIYQILESPIGKELQCRFPQFHIVRDPAYITVKLNDDQESTFAAILRENPFQAENSLDKTSLAALCQDAIGQEGSRLAVIIRCLANQEQRPTDQVSLDWFRRYLNISLEPLLWLYSAYSITISAHQQNSLVDLQAGYPSHFFFRDNQDYYYDRSFQTVLGQILPGIGRESQTICEAAVIEERLIYYFFINNLFGLINAFGVARLADEHLLLQELRMRLEGLAGMNQRSSTLLNHLLSNPELRCKANLLTRFHDLDEVAGAVAAQPVYIDIDNPLYQVRSYNLSVASPSLIQE